MCFSSCRYERLEEQLNDLTELHQNEMTNLKQELASEAQRLEDLQQQYQQRLQEHRLELERVHR